MEQKKRIKPGNYTLAKNHLINYRFYKATINRRLERLNEIVALMDGLKGTDYSADKVQASSLDTTTEKIVAEKMQVENELRRAIAIVADIERGLVELDQEQRQVVELKYININSYGMTWHMVAREIDYSVETCKRRGRSAICKMAEIIYSD